MYGISDNVNVIPDLISNHPRMYNVSPLRDNAIYMFQYNLIFKNHYSITIPCVGGLKHPSTPQMSIPDNNTQSLGSLFFFVSCLFPTTYCIVSSYFFSGNHSSEKMIVCQSL